MSDFEERTGSFFRGLIFGTLAGAGIYYFLTSTEEGKKVKDKIKKQGKDAFGGLVEIVEELEEKGKIFKEKTEEIQKKLEKKAEALRGEKAEEAESQLSQIEKLRERGRKATKLFTRNGRPLKKTS